MMNGAKGIVSALAVDHLATRRGLASFARLRLGVSCFNPM
jgi:hypothetical protein